MMEVCRLCALPQTRQTPYRQESKVMMRIQVISSCRDSITERRESQSVQAGQSKTILVCTGFVDETGDSFATPTQPQKRDGPSANVSANARSLSSRASEI